MERLRRFFFTNNNTSQTVVKNTIWLILSEIISRLFRFFIIIYAARKLGAAGWGTFSYALGIGGILMIFSDIGLSGYITRELTQGKEDSKQMVSTAILNKMIMLIISTILMLGLGPLITKIPGAVALIPIVALILFFDSLKELGLAINRAYEKMERDAFVKIVTSTIVLIGGLALLKWNTTPTTLALIYLFSSILGFSIIFWILRGKISEISWKAKKLLILPIFANVLPFAFTSLLSSILANTDIYMLGIWRTPSDIGIYSAGQRIYQFLLFIPSIIGVTTFPLLARLKTTDMNKFKKILERSLSIVFLFGLPITIGGIVIAEEIVLASLGSAYIQAVPIFQILLLLVLISFPSIIISNAIFASNRQKIFFISSSVGAVSNIILNLLFIPPFGIIGATISTVISFALSTILMWLTMKKVCSFCVLKNLKKPVLAGILMFFLCLLIELLGINFIINVILSALTYGLSLYLLKEESVIKIKDLLFFTNTETRTDPK